MNERPGKIVQDPKLQVPSQRQYNKEFIPFSLYQYIPNALTILRLIGTPVCIWVIANGKLTIALWVFFTLCITDWLDGFLARKWHVSSKLGQILDPIADKLLIISIYFALGTWGFIPFWLTVLVLTRDFLILGISCGIFLILKTKVLLPPSFTGKICTSFQMFYIGLVLDAGQHTFLSFPLSSIENYLMVFFLYGVAFFTILSGIDYGRVGFNVLRNR